jgi:hypothetical protein
MNSQFKFPIGYEKFNRKQLFNFQLNRPYSFGYARFEDLKEVGSRINSFKGWKREMLKLAENAVSEERYMNATFYYRAAEFYTKSNDPEKNLLYNKFIELFYNTFGNEGIERHQIPYENTLLSAIRLPSSNKNKGTIVIHGGFDSFIEEFYSLMKYFSNSGYEVIGFEGPGQGATLRQYGIPITIEWEKPTKAILDYRLRHFVNMANMAKCSKLGEIIPNTMEQRFKSLSLFEFQERFSNAADCLKYLADEKWGNGFVCRKCGHTHSCAGKATQSRQCTCCRYVESPTAQTLFHKVKFDLLKAFYIVYFVSTNKKGITSTELSRKLNLRQKTCWGFKRKVMKAMESSENHPIEGDVEVDETVFGGQEENTKGRKNINKKLVVLAIEKKNKGVSRLYARVIPNASAEQLGGFMKAHIDPKAKITTDKWTGYIPLKADFENLTRVASGKKGSNFPELHRVVMNLKSWLRGVHHHVNDLQDYLNEYCYRFNRSFMKENIFDNLMKRMIEAEPCYIKNISQ